MLSDHVAEPVLTVKVAVALRDVAVLGAEAVALVVPLNVVLNSGLLGTLKRRVPEILHDDGEVPVVVITASELVPLIFKSAVTLVPPTVPVLLAAVAAMDIVEIITALAKATAEILLANFKFLIINFPFLIINILSMPVKL